MILLTILIPRGTIDIHTLFGSTGEIVSPLKAEGKDTVVFVLIDLVSLVIASKIKLDVILLSRHHYYPN